MRCATGWRAALAVLAFAAIGRGGPDAPPRDIAAVQPARAVYPIDLDTSLRLAAYENPRIAEARVAILIASADQLRARSILLPSLNAGGNYHNHTGNLQRSSGRIYNVASQSLYLGGGARTVAAETVAFPAVNIDAPLTDALFEPLAARRRLDAARFEARATANDVLLEVAVLHQELAGTSAALEALRGLVVRVDEVVRITREFAAVGQGRTADADRALAERQLLLGEAQRAEGELHAASARLAQRLNLDPSLRLVAAPPGLVPLTLMDDHAPLPELLQAAVARRPELAAGAAAIAEADARYRQELWRPWLPTVWLGFSGGVFGGGSNLVPPTMGNFAGRTDFDVRAYWTILNLGAGNRSLQRRRLAQQGQAVARRQVALNLVREQVTSARAGSIAARSEMDQYLRAAAAAEEGFREDLDRIREGEGRPIEALNNLNRLVRARLDYVAAVVEYNRQQLRLYVALGTPPPVSTPRPPAPPPSAVTPLHAPFAVPAAP